MRESSSLLPPEPWPQRISRILAWIGGAIILVGCSGLITIDVITRYLFKRGMVESFEMSGYALAACIGLGLGFATTSKTHIRVDILLDAFPRPLRVAFDLLAALSLALLAVGFARPFLKQSVPPDDDRGAARRIVVLVDTSASMRREGLWAAARGQAEAALRQAGPADQVELLAFDRGVTPLFSFDEWKATPVGDRVAQAVGRLAATSPGWSSTQLGHALVRAAEDLAGPDDAGQPGPREILLISDLQEGSRLEALQA